MRTLEFSTQFKKDYKLCQKRGYDMRKLHEVLKILEAGIEIPTKYRDHPLIGKHKGCRDLHIEPDWVLVYEEIGNTVVLIITTGTHSALFKK